MLWIASWTRHTPKQTLRVWGKGRTRPTASSRLAPKAVIEPESDTRAFQGRSGGGCIPFSETGEPPEQPNRAQADETDDKVGDDEEDRGERRRRSYVRSIASFSAVGASAVARKLKALGFK